MFQNYLKTPSSGSVSGTGFYFEGEDESQRRDNQVKQVDANYISLYDIDLVAGSNPDRIFAGFAGGLVSDNERPSGDA